MNFYLEETNVHITPETWDTILGPTTALEAIKQAEELAWSHGLSRRYRVVDENGTDIYDKISGKRK